MNKVHQSWKDLKPNEYEKDFRFEEYFERIAKNDNYKYIPKLVFEQWIFGLHQNEYTLNNYAWIDYTKIKFEICEWEFQKFQEVNVIEDFKPYFLERAKCKDFMQFCCIDDDLSYWKEYGTWRIPPIILDVNSLTTKIPSWCEIMPPFQLIEGHTRLGYLHSMKRISELNKGKLASKHSVYLMVEKDANI